MVLYFDDGVCSQISNVITKKPRIEAGGVVYAVALQANPSKRKILALFGSSRAQKTCANEVQFILNAQKKLQIQKPWEYAK